MNTRTNLALLAALALTAGAFAQPAPTRPATPATTANQDEIVVLDPVSVTGSNISGVETEKILPITITTAQDIRLQGISSMSEFVESLPFSSNVTINETTTGPNDARGDVATINLRNLGAGRTLVLLNGRRLSAHGVTPGTPPVQFVNVNAIPLAAVEQVEVLRDGASAIYGSDAIGGVVNTILKKSYNGFDSSVRYSVGRDGPDEFTYDLGGGKSFNNNRTGLAVAFNYYKRDGVLAKDRAYAANADKRPVAPGTFSTNTALDRRSTSGPYGRFTALTDAGVAVSVPGVTATNGQFYYEPTTGALVAGGTPTPSTNYNSQNNAQLVPDIRRYNLFLALDHKLSDAISFFGEGSYYDSHSSGGFDAIPISAATDGIVIPKTNYYNPVGNRSGVATPRNVSIRNYRVTEGGPRSYDSYSDSYRLLGGLRGAVTGTTWKWETGALYMRGHTHQVNHGYISVSRLNQQLALATPDAYNPFGAPGANPAAAWRPFIIDIWDDGVGEIGSIDAKASGEVFELPGGPVALAVGGEWRREAMQQRNDPFGLADDVIAQSEQLDVDAARNVASAFVEVVAPLIGSKNQLPLAKSLELRAAGRYERYTNFDATKPGVGLSYRPGSAIIFRASYNEGFRAPAIAELFTPAIGRRNEGIVDTLRPGQPDAVAGVSKRVVTGGNPLLQPEESESTNYGLVVDVPFFKGLSLGADVYRIKQRNQIENTTATSEITLDAQLRAAGGSNPRVIRAAQTPTDVTLNIPGAIVEIQSNYRNLSLREVKGADFFLNYRTPRFAIGRFNVNTTISYTDRLRSIDDRGNVTELVRNDGAPRTRATASLSWSRQGWSASVFQRYTGNYFTTVGTGAAATRYIVPSYDVTNINAGYSFRSGRFEGVRVRVGANNLFDESPPFYPVSTAGYDSTYADARGRTVYAEVGYKF